MHAEGVKTLTILESLFNSLDDVSTLKMTPNSNVNHKDYEIHYSSAYVELDNVEKIPEASTVAALSLLAVSGLVCNKKRHSTSKI